jgi:hypothetical protein
MTSIAPRRECPECHREIAVVSGRYARHDPPGRRPGAPLISCPGSHTPHETTRLALGAGGTPSIYELIEGVLHDEHQVPPSIQDPLFPKPVVAF